MTDFAHLLQVLASGQVDFILVGGVAATIHGSARLTQDIDVVYSRQPKNIARLVDALAPLEPYLGLADLLPCPARVRILAARPSSRHRARDRRRQILVNCGGLGRKGSHPKHATAKQATKRAAAEPFQGSSPRNLAKSAPPMCWLASS